MATINLAEFSYSVSVDGRQVQQDFNTIDRAANTTATSVMRSFSELNNRFRSNFTELNKFADGMSSVGKKLTLGLTTPIIGMATMFTKAASSLEQTQRRTQVIYGDMTKSVQDWALANERCYGLGSGTIENYVGQIGDLTQGLGLGKKESLEMAKGATELGVQLANWGGYKTDEVIRDLNSALTGSYEGLQKYGIKLNDAALSQKAMEMGLGDNYQALDNATKAQVIYQASLGASQNAVDFWNEGNRSTSFYLTEVKEQIGNVAENMGKLLLPKVLEITKKVGDLVTKFAQWSSENPKTLETILKLGGALALIGPTLFAIGKGIKIFTTVSTIFKTVSAMATAAGASLTTFLTPIGLIVAAVAGLGIAIATDFGGIRTCIVSVMGSIKEIITSVVGIIKQLWENNFMGIKDFTMGMFETIKKLFNTVFTAISDVFKIFSAAFKGDWEGVWNGVKTFVSNLWNNIKDLFKSFLNTIVEFLVNIGLSLLDAAKTAWGKCKEGFKIGWDLIMEFIKSVINDPVGTVLSIGSALWDAGKSIFSSLWDGIKSIWGSISRWVGEKVEWIKDKVTFWKNSKNEMNDSSSPSPAPYSGSIMGSYAIGNNNIANNGLALLHKGEMVIPRDYNPFNSGKLAEAIAMQMQGGNTTNEVTINNQNTINTPWDERKFGDKIGRQMTKELNKMGVKI